MEQENIFDKIQEIFGQVPGTLNILEEQIDIDLQMEYFECSKNCKDQSLDPNLDQIKKDIFDDGLSLESRKHMIAQLASVEDVDAYRTLQRYNEKASSELRDWSVLALQESRMLLESRLLDENQVFISTGLGGRDNKLRYFLVLVSKNAKAFNEIQKKVVHNEFPFILNQYKAEVEKIYFEENLATLLVIVPLQVNIQQIFGEAIQECNLFGNFISHDYMVTNVKELTILEIKEFLNKGKVDE